MAAGELGQTGQLVVQHVVEESNKGPGYATVHRQLMGDYFVLVLLHPTKHATQTVVLSVNCWDIYPKYTASTFIMDVAKFGACRSKLIHVDFSQLPATNAVL